MKKIFFLLSFVIAFSNITVEAQHSKAGIISSSRQTAAPASTLNPTAGATTKYAHTLYGGDLSAVHVSGFGNGCVTSTGFVTVGGGNTGLRRFQVTWNFLSGAQAIAFYDPTSGDVLQIPGQESNSWAWWSSGDYVAASSFTGPGASYAAADVTDAVVDLATGVVTFYKNGVAQPATGFTLPAGNYYAMIGGQDNEPPLTDFTVSFGPTWTFSIPGTTGF